MSACSTRPAKPIKQELRAVPFHLLEEPKRSPKIDVTKNITNQITRDRIQCQKNKAQLQGWIDWYKAGK